MCCTRDNLDVGVGRIVCIDIYTLRACVNHGRHPAMLRTASHEQDDVEWRGADYDRPAAQNGFLHQESSNDKRKRQTGCFCAPQLFGGGIYLPDPSTYDPIEILINTEDRRERDHLTEIWRDNKLSELNFVGVVVRIGDTLVQRCR
jgi:hypothetical protein